MSKVTLSVDPVIVARAKRYAKQRGVSVSEMVEAYLAFLAEQVQQDVPPILRELRGTLSKANTEDYKRHLAEKYR